MIANSKAFPYQYDRGIVDMFYDSFTTYPLMWQKVFKKGKAPKGADYTRADLSGLGATLREVGEGEAVQYEVPLEGNKVTRYYKIYQLGFQITEVMLEDELFDKMKSMSSGLARAAQYTIEAKAWALFNTLTSALAKDGKALLANNHATLKGTTINNLSTADLDTTSLQQAHEYFQSLYSEDDVPITEFLGKLVVPLAEQWKATELLKATGRVMDSLDRAAGNYNKGLVAATTSGASPSGVNAPNMLNPSMGIMDAWEVVPCRYITDSDSWCALSKNFDGEVLFKREPTLQSADDLATGNRLYRTSTRFLPHIEEYRYMYGGVGA